MAGAGDEPGTAGADTTVVARADELSAGTVMLVEVDGRRICLARTDDGEVFAVDDTCTHEEESLSEGWLMDDCVECPAHNSMFDLRTGEAISLPADEPVATYPVTQVDGEIHLVLPD